MKQLQNAKIDEFKAHLRGDVLLPGDADYDEVRQIWNAMLGFGVPRQSACSGIGRPEVF